MALVVDASVLVTYLTGGKGAEEVRARLAQHERELWAPHLLDAEAGQALRRNVRHGVISASAAADALEDLAHLPLQRAPHRGLLDRAWTLRHNLSFYDAIYVALAERLGASLLTFDRRIARAPGLRAPVEALTS